MWDPNKLAKYVKGAFFPNVPEGEEGRLASNFIFS